MFQVRDLFCRRHKTVICSKCFGTNHKDCGQNVTGDVILLAREARGRLQHWASKLQSCNTNIDQEIKAIEQERDSNISKINQEYDDLEMHFREQRREFINQARSQADRDIAQLQESQGHSRDDWEVRAHEQVVRRLASAPDLSLLAMTSDLEERLSDLDLDMNSSNPPRKNVTVVVKEDIREKIKKLSLILMSLDTNAESDTSYSTPTSRMSASTPPSAITTPTSSTLASSSLTTPTARVIPPVSQAVQVKVYILYPNQCLLKFDLRKFI